MATNFPASLDTLTNPTSSDSLSSPSHSAQHANVNDAVEALQAKVGADSSAVTSSLDYKVAQLESDVAGLVTGKILQVVSTTKTDTFSASLAEGADADVTGLSLTITPSSATSKIMLFANVVGGYTDGARFGWRFVRDSTDIAVGTTGGGSRTAVTSLAQGDTTSTNSFTEAGGSFLDSPATTSAITYKIQAVHVANASGTHTIYVNRSATWSTVVRIGAPVSTITAMEVSA
jgi:hypothetical protein